MKKLFILIIMFILVGCSTTTKDDGKIDIDLNNYRTIQYSTDLYLLIDVKFTNNKKSDVELDYYFRLKDGNIPINEVNNYAEATQCKDFYNKPIKAGETISCKLVYEILGTGNLDFNIHQNTGVLSNKIISSATITVNNDYSVSIKGKQ